MSIPFFSIIIPVYKVEKYLRYCVDSIITQTFKDIEIILVDDGSPDSCPQICDEYSQKDNRIKVIHKSNGGLSDARNFGLKISSGQYILFIDSDDFIDNEQILFQAFSLLQSNQYDMLLFGYTKLFENSGKKEKMSMFKTANISSGTIEEIIDNNLYVLSAWCKIIKHDVLLNNNIEFRKGIFCEDMEWTVKLAQCVKKICILKSEDYIYRQRIGSITNSITEKNINDIELNINRCFDLAKEVKNKELRKSLNIYLTKFISMYLITLSCLESSERKVHITYAKKIAKHLKFANRKREKIIYWLQYVVGIKFVLVLLHYIMQRKKDSYDDFTRNEKYHKK